MDTASLDDFSALNEQLAALVDAGVPLDVALGNRHRSASAALQRIETIVTRRVNRGETLGEAVEGDDDELPASYRSLLQTRMHSGNISMSLDGSNHVAESIDESRFTLTSALIYPLVLFFLAYLGLIGFCLYLVPVLQGMYESVRTVPGPALRILEHLRGTMLFWSAIPPLLLVVAFVVWKRKRSRHAAAGTHADERIGWLPGGKQTLFQERCAHFSAVLGGLLEGGTPLGQALRIAGDGCNDSRLNTGAHLLANEAQTGSLPSDSSRAASLFPPFLRWALWHADESTGRSRALGIAARMYRELAQRRVERLRTLAPVLATFFLGGAVALLYGLALFVPFIELLRTLASPLAVQ